MDSLKGISLTKLLETLNLEQKEICMLKLLETLNLEEENLISIRVKVNKLLDDRNNRKWRNYFSPFFQHNPILLERLYKSKFSNNRDGSLIIDDDNENDFRFCLNHFLNPFLIRDNTNRFVWIFNNDGELTEGFINNDNQDTIGPPSNDILEYGLLLFKSYKKFLEK